MPGHRQAGEDQGEGGGGARGRGRSGCQGGCPRSDGPVDGDDREAQVKKSHAVGSLSLALLTGKKNLMLCALYLLPF